MSSLNNSDSTFSIKGVYSSEKLISEGFNGGIAIEETTYKSTANNNEILATVVESMDTNDSNIEENEEKYEVDTIEKKEIFNDSTFENESQIDNEITINKTPKDTQALIVENIKKDTVDEPKKFKELELNKKTANDNIQNVITNKKINNNIDYKVQILAGHKIVNSSYFAAKFNFKENYEIESHMGWIKYTVGNHSEYKKARDSRNELKNHEFPGPFVSAYNYGERISVQEALILSKQSWIP
ncbi:MAG: hypothetical protein CBC95_005145 [Crocinitomicaceae bacterium TMED135]|nr:MAG: hypothetical protein CBC95_005145 [Crocinitomicaceae bacterium TMED135]